MKLPIQESFCGVTLKDVNCFTVATHEKPYIGAIIELGDFLGAECVLYYPKSEFARFENKSTLNSKVKRHIKNRLKKIYSDHLKNVNLILH